MANKRKGRFKKGSKEAKAYMAKIRAKSRGIPRPRTKTQPKRKIVKSKTKKYYVTGVHGAPGLATKAEALKFMKAFERSQRLRGLEKPLKRRKVKKNTMAKKKKTTTRRQKISAFGGARMKPLTVGLALGVAEPLIDQLTAKVGIGLSDDIVKIGLGYFLSGMRGFGSIPSMVGTGMMTLGARNLVAGKVNLSGLLGGNGTPASNGDSTMIG